MHANWVHLIDARVVYVKDDIEFPDSMADAAYEVDAGDLFVWAQALDLELRPARRTDPEARGIVKKDEHYLRVWPRIDKVVTSSLQCVLHVDYIQICFNDLAGDKRKRIYNGSYVVDVDE